jgi:hypothetical protein
MQGGLNMGITLEKIELVKDRTGVTYKEAKEALEKADGNVVDAIVAIEENIDEMTSTRKIGAKGTALMDKVKEVVKRGNVTKIEVRHDGDTVLNLPLNAGILGVVIAPWGVLLGVLAAFGFKCTVDLIKDDGSVISLSDKAEEIAAGAVEAGSKAAQTVKEKTPEVVETVTNSVSEMVEKVKGSADDDEPYVDEEEFDEEWFRDDQPAESQDENSEDDAEDDQPEESAQEEPAPSEDEDNGAE